MEPGAPLAQLIRERKDVIVRRWAERVRKRPIAQRLPEPYLQDSVPDLLAGMAEAVEQNGQEHKNALGARTIEQARRCLALGYEPAEVIGEYVDLREAVHEVLADVAGQIPVAAWYSANCVIDEVLVDLVDHFGRLRARKLEALERISSEPLTAPDVPTLLARLLDVMLDVAPEVDTVTILLCEATRSTSAPRAASRRRSAADSRSRWETGSRERSPRPDSRCCCTTPPTARS
jgi:hypothetical protein